MGLCVCIFIPAGILPSRPGTMNRFSAIGIVLIFVFGTVRAQDWKLLSDKDRIQSYTKPITGSKIHAVKVSAEFAATPAQFVSVILDVAAYDGWIYNSRSSRLLKQVSASEFYYYGEVIFPWPTQNRDFVSHVNITQDAVSKMVHIRAENVQGMVPEKAKIVRINHSLGHWMITGLAEGKIRVTYELETDPGGDLPAWLINSFSSKGLVETFKNLRRHITRSAYAAAQYPFIKLPD